MRIFYFLIILLSSIQAVAQMGTIKGRIYNSINNDPIPFANVVIQGTTTGSASDIDGNYTIENLQPGLYSLEVSFIGFKKKTIYEIQVTSAKTVFIDFPLEEKTTELDIVEIKASPFNKTEESPVSLRTIGVSEIQRAPGGNRDISQVIQNLPGVASTPSFRNDIIIRGGAPNENRFYLDGIEVPNINHFATQGSSGGPVGLLNVNFIQEVDYYAGAFPSNRGNALSSVFEFKQKEGNPEKLAGTFLLGSSDAGITLDGPINDKSSFVFSVRRSYLQFLFSALKLPFLPTYNDAQFKYTWNINNKNRISVIGLGALDDFTINTGVNDGVEDSATLARNEYILGNIPVNNQWNYTVGVNYRHFADKSFQTFVVSRNHLNNSAFKYFNNSEIDSNLLFDYESQEIENKVRFEHTYRNKGYKLNAGVNYENATYTNSTFNKIPVNGVETIIDFDSKLNFNKYGLFIQGSKTLLEERLTLSAGLRTDWNDYSSEMSNPINQISPRFSAAYSFAPKWSLNFNTGRYYQLPAYTIMGFRNNNDELVNKDLGLKYISVDHVVGGIEYNSSRNRKITIEAFYKNYQNYPFSLRDSLSLANLGADFGVIGNEAITSSSEGRAYGLELLVQQKIFKGFYGILAYTLMKSEFTDKTGEFKPSAWDFGNIVNLTAGKKFKKDWEIGIRFRYSGGAPYTPFNNNISSLRASWDLIGVGVLDYNALNTLRLASNNQMDVRVDKKWFFNKWALNIYLDIQNVYAGQIEDRPFLDVLRDANGNPLVDPNDPSRYQVQLIENSSGTVLPTIGLQIDW